MASNPVRCRGNTETALAQPTLIGPGNSQAIPSCAVGTALVVTWLLNRHISVVLEPQVRNSTPARTSIASLKPVEPLLTDVHRVTIGVHCFHIVLGA